MSKTHFFIKSNGINLYRKDSSILNKPNVFLYMFKKIFLTILFLFLLYLILTVKYGLGISTNTNLWIILGLSIITFFSLTRYFLSLIATHTRPKYYTSDDDATFSFVIPCKDEVEGIASTIRNCFAINYPASKYEVIVVNDGSTDGTTEVLEKLKKEYRNLQVIHFPTNRGKRQAMRAGFLLASKEIIIQLDSDSFIDGTTISNLLAPFNNDEVGAVCAYALPKNSNENWLTKMQTAYYFSSFRVFKEAESATHTVFCCSGCASAYRRKYVTPLLDRWVDEKFLGLPVTYGDDRALTNLILETGYKTLFIHDTTAETIVPNSFKKFLKQQLRWKKGWIINSFMAAKFIWKRHPIVSLFYFFPLVVITFITPILVGKVFLYDLILQGNYRPALFYVLGIYLFSLLVAIRYMWVPGHNKKWFYLLVWSTFNIFLAPLLLIWALFTLRDRSWGTR